MVVEAASVPACVSTFKCKYLKGYRAIGIKFCLKHYWGGRKVVVGLRPCRVSKATDSSHRLTMGKIAKNFLLQNHKA